MKRAITIGLSSSTFAFLLSGNALPGPELPAQIRQEMQETNRDVIVVLRDQLANVPPIRRAMGARAASLAASQSSVMSLLPRVQGRKFHAFSTINAFATSVSASELAQLSSDVRVQAVVPDAVIRPPVRKQRVNEPAGSSSVSAAATDGGLCNTLEPEALQATNTAFLDPTIPQAQRVRDGNGQFVTGKGVKVAWIADGLDPNIPAFIRPDGSHVFIDYQDFTGDPAGSPTGGEEAFGDAGTIAAQNTTFDISKYVNAVHPLPSPCNIQFRGMAPGASLVGLDVFGTFNPTTTSNFVQAIEYAVIHDDVDVINESFGGNPFPDNTNDPISLADDAAVRAGVTVVVSTGDAGTAGTLGSPATSASSISVGGSTTFRIYAQTGDGIIPFSNGGYIDNNISSLSSGGFAQRKARTVDVVAPGDLGWGLCSTNVALFEDCFNVQKPAAPTPILEFGGTSESSPTTAGAAALVIQAYRSTHGGRDPSPATVKQLLMSTATDLNAPSFEQGAGLINSLAAVNAALSINDENGHPGNRGESLLVAPSSAQIIAQPNHPESVSFTITNEGTTPQHLTPTFETLGSPTSGATLNLTLDPATDPTFLNIAGNPRAYIKKTFKVPAAMEHLDAAIAFQTVVGSSNPPLVFFGLLDPSGRQAAFSIPQGLGSGYGHVDVANPQGGTWTVIVYTRVPGVNNGSYSGPVQFVWATENFVKIGSVSPAHLNLAAGASASVTADFSMPSSPGDSSAALRFVRSPNESNEKYAQVPVSLRTLIPTGATGGSFSGTLTGGNSRAGAGPTQTFEFDVPHGVNNMSLVLNIPDNGYLLEGLLVDPNGMQLSLAPNQDPLDGSAQFALQLAHYNPQAGRWKFVLLQNFTSSGNQTSLPFTARIGFNSAKISAAGLPNSTSVELSASAPLVVPITVKNTGAITQLYFADARLDTQTITALPAQPGGCSGPVVTLPGYCALNFLPTQASIAAFVAQASVPITMDSVNDVGTGVGFTGSPDIYAKSVGNDTVVALISEPEIPYSAWFSIPSEIGPYGPSGAPTASISTSAYVLMKPFDSAASADSGDIWADLVLNTNTFNPLILAPGETGTIHVTITPDPTMTGKTVTGFIYIDTFSFTVTTGDEVVALPYRYTVTK